MAFTSQTNDPQGSGSFAQNSEADLREGDPMGRRFAQAGFRLGVIVLGVLIRRPRGVVATELWGFFV